MDHSQAVWTQRVSVTRGARRVRTALRLGGILLCGILVSVAGGAADTPSSSSGLKGIIPTEVPDGLTNGISQLPENWEKWGTGLADDLTALYGGQDLDAAGQQKVLDSLKRKLKTLQGSLADKRFRAMDDVLITLQDGLARRIEVLDAVLATLALDPSSAKAELVKSAGGNVVAAARGLESYLKPIPNSAGWVRYFKVDKLLAALEPDAGPDALAAVQATHRQFEAKNKLTDEKTKEFLSAPQFGALAQSVDHYVDAANREAQPANAEEVRKQLGTLVTNLELYESSASDAAAKAVRGSFGALRKLVPDGGERLSKALQVNYFNYNLQVYASDGILNRLIASRHDENGPVTDYFMGANIGGNQTTSTVVGLQLLPSNNSARFDVTLNGHIVSSTAGATSQATIYSQGNHTFVAKKEVVFDGKRFRTAPATIQVNASVATTGANTNVGFLFHNYANRVAMGRAEGMRGASEAHAAGRVQEQVLPRFNQEVDAEFAKANNELNANVAGPLKEMHLYPDAIVYRTTPQQLSVSSRLMQSDALGGNKVIPAPVTSNGLTILVHESLINNAVDEMGIAGKTLTENELRALLEEKFGKLLNREIKLPSPEGASGAPGPEDADKGPKALIFADNDPIRIQFAGNQVILTIRAGFKREDKEDIPQQVVRVPLNFKIEGNRVIATRGDVSVTPVSKPANAAEQVALAGIVRRKIESSLPTRELDRKFRLKKQGGAVDASLSQVKALDGWVALVLQ